MFDRSVVDDKTIFIAWNKEYAHLHKLIKDSVVGGPSIIFNRYLESGVSRIKGGPKVKAVFGYDCTAMYCR